MVDAMSQNRLDQALALTFGDDDAIDEELAPILRSTIRASALLDNGRAREAGDILDGALRQLEAMRPIGPLFVPHNVAATIARDPRLMAHAGRVIGVGSSRPRFDLTERERELCRMLLGDLSLRQIAAELGRTENTLKTHRRHLYGKLGITTRDELKALAVREPSLWDGFRPSRRRQRPEAAHEEQDPGSWRSA